MFASFSRFSVLYSAKLFACFDGMMSLSETFVEGYYLILHAVLESSQIRIPLTGPPLPPYICSHYTTGPLIQTKKILTHKTHNILE